MHGELEKWREDLGFEVGDEKSMNLYGGGKIGGLNGCCREKEIFGKSTTKVQTSC